ncbi:MAG: SDR family oxidoreductase [Myxococcales bacterium]|nr:SDR family oxidoreductase [Myxococcales bacterium]
MDLDQLKVIVTGGASGLGEHFAKRLHEAGAQVAVGDINEEALKALPDGIHRRRLDVADQDDIARFVPWAAEQMGGLNALINNAGIIRDALWVGKSRKTGEIRRMSREDWDAVIAVNLTGAVLMVQEVVAHMVERGVQGVIVNVSSVARHGNRGQTNYVAAKAALAANTRTWMKEFSPYGIRVGAVAPGVVKTPMTAGMNQKALDMIRAAIPLGRMGQPEDIWRAVKFIFECDYFTGETIDVNGGVSR